MANSDHDKTSVSETDRNAIEHSLHLLNMGRDRRDAQLLKSIYLPDAMVRFGPIPTVATVWIDRMCGSADTLASIHRTTNILILQEDDQARSESYCIAHVQIPDQGMQRFLGGRYLDRHRRSDEGWNVAARHFVFDWTIDLPIDEALFARQLTVSASAPVDECQAQLAALLNTEIRSVDRGETDKYAALMNSGAVSASFHALFGLRFHINGDIAAGVCEILAVLTDTDDIVVRGRLSLSARRVDGIWAFTERSFAESWRGQRLSSKITLPFDRGRRDRGDPVYAFWCQ